MGSSNWHDTIAQLSLYSLSSNNTLNENFLWHLVLFLRSLLIAITIVIRDYLSPNLCYCSYNLFPMASSNLRFLFNIHQVDYRLRRLAWKDLTLDNGIREYRVIRRGDFFAIISFCFTSIWFYSAVSFSWTHNNWLSKCKRSLFHAVIIWRLSGDPWPACHRQYAIIRLCCLPYAPTLHPGLREATKSFL